MDRFQDKLLTHNNTRLYTAYKKAIVNTRALDGWMDGWMGRRMDGRAQLRIAYINNKKVANTSN